MDRHRLLPSSAITLMLLGAGASASAQEVARQDPGQQPVDQVISPAEEATAGRQALERFLDQNKATADGNLNIKLGEIGRKVARFSDRPDLDYSFQVIRGNGHQGYAFPGGAICLTEGLARLHASDDELAFYAAHELAHIALRHYHERYRFLLSLEGDRPLDQAMLEAVTGRFDRGQEREADTYGALYAVRAGYQYSAAVTGLRRLAEKFRGPAQDSRHPDFAQRVEALVAFRSELEFVLEKFRRGTESLKAGRTQEAIAALSIFVAEFPQSLPGHVNLGLAYVAKVRSTAGTPGDLAEVLPILPEPGIKLRGTYDRLDLERARDNFNRALRTQPGDPVALAALALVDMRLGDNATARDNLNKALEQDPDNPQFALLLGNVEFQAGRYEQALSLYDQALILGRNWPEAKHNLAITMEKLERFDEARALWGELRQDPRFRERAIVHLADLNSGT